MVTLVTPGIGNAECPEYDHPCALATKFSHHVLEDGAAEDLSSAFTAATAVEIACDLLIPN